MRLNLSLILISAMLSFAVPSFAYNSCRVALERINSLQEVRAETGDDGVHKALAEAIILETPLFEREYFARSISQALHDLNPINGHMYSNGSLKDSYTKQSPAVQRAVAIKVWQNLRKAWDHIPSEPKKASMVEISEYKKNADLLKIDLNDMLQIRTVIDNIEADPALYNSTIDIVQMIIPTAFRDQYPLGLGLDVKLTKKFSRKRLLKAALKSERPSRGATVIELKVNLTPKANHILSADPVDLVDKKTEILNVLTEDYALLFHRSYFMAFNNTLTSFKFNSVDDFIKGFDDYSNEQKIGFAGQIWDEMTHLFLAKYWEAPNDPQVTFSLLAPEKIRASYGVSTEDYLANSYLIFQINQRPELKKQCLEVISQRLRKSAEFELKYKNAAEISNRLGFLAAVPFVGGVLGSTYFVAEHIHPGGAQVAAAMGTFITTMVGGITPVTKALDKVQENQLGKYDKYLKEHRHELLNANDETGSDE